MHPSMKTRLWVLVPFLLLCSVIGTGRMASGSEAASRSESTHKSPAKTKAGINATLIRHAEAGSLNGAKQDLKQGANVNFRDPKKGKTALIKAAEGGYLKTAELLLSHGAKVDIKDRYGHIDSVP